MTDGPPEDEARSPPSMPPASRRDGTPGKGVIGLFVGAAIGVPIGFLFYMVAREFYLPTDLWSSDLVMWQFIVGVMAACALIGWKRGANPTRAGDIAFRAMNGFLIGAVVSAFVSAIVALLLGEWFQVSQREGAFAMGVAFTIAPLCGLIGGVAFAIYRVVRTPKR